MQRLKKQNLKTTHGLFFQVFEDKSLLTSYLCSSNSQYMTAGGVSEVAPESKKGKLRTVVEYTIKQGLQTPWIVACITAKNLIARM